MKPLTELCLEELEFAGGKASEIADRLSEDVQKVAKALCKLATQKRIESRVMDVERRVYFYFVPKLLVAARRAAKKKKGRRRVAGHVYFRQFQMRWG